MLTVLPSGDQIGNTYLMFEILLSFLLISMTYILLALKLYQQSRNVLPKGEVPKRITNVLNTVHHITKPLACGAVKQETRTINGYKLRSKSERFT